MTRAVICFDPSTPSSAPVTVRSTNPSLMFWAESVTNLGGVKATPPISRSTRSFSTAPEPPRTTRSVVVVADSARLRKPSVRLFEPCSSGTAAAKGAVVSMTMAFVSARFAPAGGSDASRALPARSRTVPAVNAATVRSGEF